MVTCHVAEDRQHRARTSATSRPRRRRVDPEDRLDSNDPVRVLLFFPEVNEVKDQVKQYFEALAQASGKITIEGMTGFATPT